MKKIFLKIVIGVVLACILFVCFLYEHFPGIGGKVLRVELGHFLLDQGPFFRRHRDAQHKVSCSVCHSFTVLSEQGFGAFPNKQPATARRDRGGPVFGSVATLPMLATLLFLR